MSNLRSAGAMLAGLHVLEAFADMVIDKHENAEHVTYGDVANTLANVAPSAVKEAGIEDDVWRAHKPARKPGRQAANAGKTT